MARDWIRTYVHQRVALDIRKLQGGRNGRVNLLKAGNEFTWYAPASGHVASIRAESGRAVIRYQAKVDGRQVSRAMAIAVTKSSCKLGGARSWWLCPNCTQRVAILYGWGVFQCRRCSHLHYPSQSETNADRTLRRAGKLRKLLGWEPGVVNPHGDKPLGMHWRTFYQLVARCHTDELKALCDLEAFVSKFSADPKPMSGRLQHSTSNKPKQVIEVKIPPIPKVTGNPENPDRQGDSCNVSGTVRCRDCANISAGFRCLVPGSGQTYPALGEWRHCSSYLGLGDSWYQC